MSNLTKKDLTEIKKKLLNEKKRLEKELSRFAKKDETIKDNYKATFVDLGDTEDDNAQEYAEHERMISLEHTLEEALQDVVKALKRIEEGVYGVCRYCKQPIDKERLLVRPESSSCIKCKSILKGS